MLYICVPGPHPLLMATTAPGAPPLHRCMSDFYTKKTRLKIRPKFEYGFNFQISEQSMLLVCRDYCGATPLLLHNISLLYVQTLSNNGATGPHYRFPLQGVLLYQGRYQKSRQINIQYEHTIMTQCEHLDHVWTPVKCDPLVYLEELGCSIWFCVRKREKLFRVGESKVQVHTQAHMMYVALCLLLSHKPRTT